MKNPQHNCRAPRLLAITTSALAAAAAAHAQPQGGYTVDDVIGQFQKIAHHGDTLGFRQTVGVDADLCKHYQGIIRYNALDGTPYFYLTHSMNHTSSCGLLECDSDCSDDPGELLVVRMGSRPKHRERMRSNRLSPFTNQSDTPPPANDVTVRSIRFQQGTGWPGFQHPGDGQIVDDVIVLPLEREIPGIDERGAIVFADVSNPEDPILLRTKTYDRHMGVLAITWDAARETYVLCVSGGDTRLLYFYETNVSDLHDPSLDLTEIATYNIDDAPASIQDKWEQWQNLDFIRQSDGRLFMACADNTGFTDMGEDWIRLFEVTRSGNAFSLIYRAERHLKLDDPRMGNAAAGTGYYVSPGGNLILYTSEHEDAGPQGSVRCGEFRSVDLSITGTDPSSDTWIELYQDNTGWDDPSPDRSLMFDEVDVSLEDWTDLDTEDGWGDDADSLKFRAPVGQEILLFKDQNFGGEVLRRTGNGSVQSIARLDDFGFGDAIHSVFTGIRPVPLGADLTTTMLGVWAIASSHQYQGTIGVQTTVLPYHELVLTTGFAPGYRSAYRPPASGRATILP